MATPDSAGTPATLPPPPPGPPPGAHLPPPGAPPVSAGPEWDGFAIAGFIVSLLGGVCIGTILAIIGLSRTANGRRRGYGLAVAAIVISIAWAVIIGLLAVVDMNERAEQSPTVDTKVPGSTALADVAVGDCLTEAVTATTVFNLNVKPCDEPHQGQIIAMFAMPEGPYPGEDAGLESASAGCARRVSSELASSPLAESLEMYVIYPKAEMWQGGDRDVICILQRSGKPLNGSLPGLYQRAFSTAAALTRVVDLRGRVGPVL